MERHRFREIRSLLRESAVGLDSDPRQTHSDLTVVSVLLWAALHDRPVSWATVADHWPGDLRPRPLPSQSCMSRRLRTTAVCLLVDRTHDLLRQRLPQHDIKLVDARPLAVGGCSKDPDARRGYGAGLQQRGYKLHLLCDSGGSVDRWLLTPMNGSETHAAGLLLEHGPPAAYVLADGAYDVNPLYQQAAERGSRLLALPRHKKGLRPGHRPHHPQRLENWHWTRSTKGQRTLRRVRSAIERVNAWQGMAHIGLRQPPHHVRRLHRVTLWVAMKIILYHHWLEHRIQARKTA